MKDGRQKKRLGPFFFFFSPTSSRPNPYTSKHSPSHCPRFFFFPLSAPAPSFKLILSTLDSFHPFFFPLFFFFSSTTPASDSSITSVWLPVGSRRGEMYERGEKWMANSIKSIIPEAGPCYQQRCKGVLMHCLHALASPAPSPTPHSGRNQSCCGPKGGEGRRALTESSETGRGLVSAP